MYNGTYFQVSLHRIADKLWLLFFKRPSQTFSSRKSQDNSLQTTKRCKYKQRMLNELFF